MSHEDQLGDMFGMRGYPSLPVNGHASVQGISIDLGMGNSAGGRHLADKGSKYPSGGAISNQRSEEQKEWTLAGSATLAQSSPASRPFDYPSVSSTSHPPLLQPHSSSSIPVQNHTQHDVPQIEAVAAWHDVCFFISLHMRHQHGLMPLVHKPTFAQDVLQRRDKTDETFRGLLCSIGESPPSLALSPADTSSCIHVGPDQPVLTKHAVYVNAPSISSLHLTVGKISSSSSDVVKRPAAQFS